MVARRPQSAENGHVATRRDAFVSQTGQPRRFRLAGRLDAPQARQSDLIVLMWWLVAGRARSRRL
jgi:hypothetical protein